MAENPYKTPADDRILEGRPQDWISSGELPRLTRVWRRFLSLIEALDRRLAPEKARIWCGADSVTTEIPSNVWTPLPIRNLIGQPAPVSMSIGADRMIYDGNVPNNLEFAISMYFRDLALTPYFVGIRKNGDDSTRISRQLTDQRGEFAASFEATYDVEPGDYIEVICLQALPGSTFITVTLGVYATDSGFRPGDGE